MSMTPEDRQRLLDLLEREAELSEEKIQRLKDEVDKYAEIESKLTDIEARKQALALKSEAEAEYQEQNLRLIKEQVLQGAELNEQQKEFLKSLNLEFDAQGKNIKQLDRALKNLELKQEAQGDINRMLKEQGPISAGIAKSTVLMAEAMEQGRVGALLLNRANVKLEQGFLKFGDAIKNAILEINVAEKAFARSTGNIFGESFNRSVQSTITELDIYGITAEDAYQAQLRLVQTVTDFTMMNTAQQKQLRETSALFQELGVGAGVFETGMQGAIKQLSMTPAAAEMTTREIFATGQALGVVPADLLEKFASLTPVLSKFGSEGGRVFKDLARISKITGFEMEKIFQITNRFDTFEGAAQQAGQLNAALGGNFVNAMDLLTATDPAERFEMIRDAIEQTGLSFDEMSYYQKLFYTESLGLSDVGDLAAIMSGDMTALGDSVNRSAASYEEMRKSAKAVQNVQEAFQNIIRDNANQLADFANGLNKFTGMLLDNADTIKKVVKFLGLLKLAHIGLQTIQKGGMALQAIGKAFSNAFIFITGMKTKAIEAQTEATEELRDAEEGGPERMKKSGKAADGASVGFFKMALAVGAVAAGIGLAAMGLADLITAVDEASIGSIAMAGALFMGIGAGAFFMAKGLAAVTFSATASGPALMGLGVAVGLVGVGIGVAALGMAELVRSFEGFTATEILAVGGALVGFGTAVLFLAKALAVLGNPISLAGAAALTLISGAVGGLAYAFSLLKGKQTEFEDMVPMMQSVGNISETQFKAAEQAFSGIKDAVNSIDIDKLEALEDSMGVTYKIAASPFGGIVAPAIAKVLTSRMGAETAAAGGGDTTQNMVIRADIPIHIDIGGANLKKYVLKLVKDKQSNEFIAAMEGYGESPAF